jgi:hypothetical protein
MHHAIAIKIREPGMTSHSAGAPFAVSVMVGRPSMSSLGIPAMTDFSIENHVKANKGYGGPFSRKGKGLNKNPYAI